MNCSTPVIDNKIERKSNFAPKVFAFIAIASVALMAAPAHAQTTTTTATDPDVVLDSMLAGVGKMDDIGGVGAALGMATTIFGGTALVLKRFIYS